MTFHAINLATCFWKFQVAPDTGICLAQLMRPGTPVVYGLGGTPMEMRTGEYINASPEETKHTVIASALGRYYNMPSRSQGALTESFCLDYQAGMESAMMMTATVVSGANVTLAAHMAQCWL